MNLGPTEQRSPVTAILVAFVVLAAVAVGVFYLNPRKTAEAAVTRTQTYTFTGTPVQAKGSGNVIGGAQVVEHDLYVVATLRIDNKLRLPLFLNGIEATYNAADGSDQSAHAVNISDLPRIEETFPDLKPMLPHPIDFTTAVDAKFTTEGQVLLEFPGFTEDLWKQRKSATLTLNFTHQNPMTVAIPQ